MKRETPLSCARVLVLLEPYVDGDLTEIRRRRVDLHLQHCADCSQALRAARSVQVSLRRLPELAAPDALRARLQASGAIPASAGRHWQDRLAAAVSATWDALLGKGSGHAAWLRPAAAVVAVLVIVALWAHQRQPEQTTTVAQAPETSISEEELQQAHDQARWALAYLANVTARAGDAAFVEVGDVMGQVIGEHVVGSVTDAVGRSMEPRSEKQEPSTLEEEVQAP